MSHDRVSAQFPMTHEFMAELLGVRRQTVTVTAGLLQEAGLVTFRRGYIRIVDRLRLEEAACECYGVIRRPLSRFPVTESPQKWWFNHENCSQPENHRHNHRSGSRGFPRDMACAGGTARTCARNNPGQSIAWRRANQPSQKRQPAEQAPADPLADVADIPAQDLRAGGDEKKRYFLIGAKDAKPPAEGSGLLIVLPGGDGSAKFQPFIRRIHKNVLNDRWLIAEAVAPKWDENQFNRVVWPTATSKYPAAKFTTEEFIRAIVADVRAKVKIDPRRVILLGWSSGGPPCYAEALRKDSPVTGAFIAMSVFPRANCRHSRTPRRKPSIYSSRPRTRSRRSSMPRPPRRRCKPPVRRCGSSATRGGTAGAGTSGR